MYSEYRRARKCLANGEAEDSSPQAPLPPAPAEPDPGVHTLVDTAWLKKKISEQGPDFRVVDASWHMPMTGRKGAEEYKSEHIPGAVYFDLNEVRDKSAKYGDQMLPSEQYFAEYIGNLGISRDTHVLIYDNNDNLGMFSAPRAWFIFRAYGHTKLSVLNGGLPAWKRDAGEVTTEVPTVEEAVYEAKYRDNIVKSYYDIVSNLQDKTFVYVDARPTPRYDGKAPEPRPDIKPGHIPDSLNLPFPMMLDKETKTFKPAEEIANVFKDGGVELDRPTVLSCGSGLTACFLVLGAYILGYRDIPLYDGAWTEWFQRADVADMVGVPLPEDDKEEQQEK